MARIHDKHELVLVQRHGLEARVMQLAREADLDVAPHDHLKDLLGMAGADAEAYRRMRRLEADEQLWQDVGRDRGRGTEDQLVGQRQALDRARSVLERSDGTLRVGQERPARIGKDHAPAPASEQRAADLRLEGSQPRRERGLGDEQGLRGPAQVAAPRDLQKALDLCQLHCLAAAASLRAHRRPPASRSTITVVDDSDEGLRLDLMAHPVRGWSPPGGEAHDRTASDPDHDRAPSRRRRRRLDRSHRGRRRRAEWYGQRHAAPPGRAPRAGSDPRRLRVRAMHLPGRWRLRRRPRQRMMTATEAPTREHMQPELAPTPLLPPGFGVPTSRWTHPATRFRDLLRSQPYLFGPGVYDPMGAQLVMYHGFKAVYFSGYSFAIGHLGTTDMDLYSGPEIADGARRTVAALRKFQLTSAVGDPAKGIAPRHLEIPPVVVDMDAGYGNIFNVQRQTELLVTAGVAAAHLEDQVLPKRCGHIGGKALVPAQ